MINVENRLLFAIPKKGRLSEKSISLLERIGINFRKRERHDIALCSNMDIAIIFLPAMDISLYVGQGRVDLGITGEDVVKETGQSGNVDIQLKLGFGKCKLSLAVPEKSSIKVDELNNKSIVTSFPNLTLSYFAQRKIKVNIKEVSGSVEIACAMGAADAITDLVETGDTIREAGLKIIEEIFPSEAVLISRKGSEYKDLIEILAARIQGVIYADEYALIEYNISRENLKNGISLTPGLKSPTIMPLEDNNWVAVKSVIKKKKVNDLMDELKKIGGCDILITSMDNCRI